MKSLYCFLTVSGLGLLSVLTSSDAFAQAVSISDVATTPDVNSLLDIKISTPAAPKGILLPRGTADPAVAGDNDHGLLYYNTTSQKYKYYDETADGWVTMFSGTGTGNHIDNGTSVQTGANFNIGLTGVIGTTLSVGTDLTVGAAAGTGNIIMNDDDAWIGRGSNASRIAFNSTTNTIKINPTKLLHVEVNEANVTVGTAGYTAMLIKNIGDASGVGLMLSGKRGLAGDPAGYIAFENTDGTTDILARVGVRNSSGDNSTGSFHISLKSGATFAEKLTLSDVGNLAITGKFTSLGIQETSDVRFKKNISSISNALATVLSLEGVTYNWRTEEFPERAFTDRMEYGVIAQQIEKYVPELVSTDENGYKSVQYSHMVPLLLEAIKEQQAIINSQSKELGILKASVDAISEHIKTAEK